MKKEIIIQKQKNEQLKKIKEIFKLTIEHQKKEKLNKEN